MEIKTFKEYFIESKKTYEFKIKLAGEVCESAVNKIEAALDRFKVESCSETTKTPIQESQADFPDHKNIEVSVVDVCLSYPATSIQIRDSVSEALLLPHNCVKVRNLKEQEEDAINHQYCPNTKSGESMLGKDYEKENNQTLAGEKHTMALLKELGKTKTQGTQYKGVNDKILAKKAPSEKPQKTVKADASTGVFGKINNPDPRKGK